MTYIGRHIDVGSRLTKLEFEDDDTHEFSNEAIELLAAKGNWYMPETAAGWTEVVVNTGASGVYPGFCYTYTAAGANSSALRHSFVGWLSGDLTDYRLIDWDKDLRIIFNLWLSDDMATGVGRWQLKEVLTIGALAAKGIGIRTDNLDLIGESYGTALGQLDLATTLTVDTTYQIEIVLTASSSIKWYVDGVLKGTQSTANTIPDGAGGVQGYFVQSVINAATAANYGLVITILKIWQER